MLAKSIGLRRGRSSIKIIASDTEPWKAQADRGVEHDTEVFEFVRK